ncbi:MAG: hypothetical protein ACK5UG_11455 [Synechococcaceae cyanobacterium]|jgi:hypothetical protein
MYERLIPSVIEAFASASESEHAFLIRLRDADIRLRQNYTTSGLVPAEPYAEPILRAAYLFRYLGHYTLQLGDLLHDLEGTAAGPLLAADPLRLAALCGGPCPEAIALASLHQQAGGQHLQATVLDLHAQAWADCWPITTQIISDYPAHPCAEIDGITCDLFSPMIPPAVKALLGSVQVFTCMNCLNELVGVNSSALRRVLRHYLSLLSPGTLVLAADLAGYPRCARGMALLHLLLKDAGAQFLLVEIDPAEPHWAANRFELPDRIAWIYSAEHQNRFRIHVRQLRLAALIR